MEDQVLTSEGFGMVSSAKGEGAQAPKPVMRRKVKEIIRRFVFDAAPKGKSSVSFPFIEKGQYGRSASGEIRRKMLTLNDGVYVCNKTMAKNNYALMEKTFLEMGFRPDHRAVYGDMEEVPLNRVPPVKKFRYKFGHPDNSVDEKVNAVLRMGIEGETVQVEFVNGFTEAEDDKIIAALTSLGFYVADKVPLDDEEPESEDPTGTPEDDPENSGEGKTPGFMDRLLGKGKEGQNDQSPGPEEPPTGEIVSHEGEDPVDDGDTTEPIPIEEMELDPGENGPEREDL